MQDKSKTYRLVNWEQSMEIGLSHFEQLENFFIDQLRDARGITLKSYNYGLLPSLDGKKSSSEFDISEQVTGKVEIRLSSCNAITSGGCRISFNPDSSDYLLYTHTFKEEDNNQQQSLSNTRYWDVIFSIDPFKRIPTGEPSINETQAKHPDVKEFYQLSITPEGKLNHDQLGTYHLVIGRICQRGGRYEVDTDFIPPVTSMKSHPELIKYYQQFGSYLNDIERASKEIIAKINNRTSNSSIADNLKRVCEDLMRYIANIFFMYRNTGHEAAPIEIVNYFSTLAHVCYVSLNFMENSEKEKLLNYFYEWSDITPGTFEEIISTALSIIYDHNSIRTTMSEVAVFLHNFTELWIKLSSLEYIGQRKGNIVVSERSHQKEVAKPTGGWTVFD